MANELLDNVVLVNTQIDSTGIQWILLDGDKDIVAKYCKDNDYKIIKQWPHNNTYRTSAVASTRGL